MRSTLRGEDLDRRRQRLGGAAEEFHAQAPLLDQRDRARDEAAATIRPGKAGAAAEIDPARLRDGANRSNCAESAMWRSQSWSRLARGNEILPLVLLAQQGGEGVEPLHCFTWNIAQRQGHERSHAR